MLNLDVCEKCVMKDLKFSAGLDREVVRKRGTICCPGTWMSVSIKTAPPKECPYALEHAVSEGMKNAR